jgi:ParB-like chromosome segregation protein Spo0J
VAPSAARSRRVPEKPAPGREWPADAVERRPVASLTAYARNARTHSEGQVAEIAASIREWGWTMPVLVDEAGGIIAGHGRVLAAQLLGLTEVPVMVARGWTEAQRRAYLIADNKLGLNSGWDDALLVLEMTDLKAMGFDLGLTGFADGEIQELFGRAAARAGLTDPDATPEVPADPISRPGDVWLLGATVTCPKCGKASPLEKAAKGK